SCTGIAGQNVGLTATTAIILETLGAAAARLLHPIEAAEPVESTAGAPDVLDTVLTHIGEFDSRQLARRMAGQGAAVRSDGKKDIPPAAHAGFGAGFIVIGHDVDQFHALTKPLPVFVGDLFGMCQL